jgi:predicted small integral membrane protein
MTARPRANWPLISIGFAALFAAWLAFLVWVTPSDDSGKRWFDPLIPGGWMAWTFPVALFFTVIAALLVIFTLLAIRYPETPRFGVLRIETTRGDRLFISLLGSAFICLGWIFFAGPPLWGALALCLIYALAVFRWV